MGDIQYNINNYTEFYYHFFRNILVVALPILVISAFILGFSVPHSSAENSSTDGVSISIPSTCTMASNIVSPHTASMIGGTQTEVDSEGIGMGTTELDTVCNDKDGYLIYAKGITQNSSNEVILSSTIGSEYDIKTGTGTMSDNRSSWGMKLIPVSGSNQYPPDIVSIYTNFTSVPNNWTKVASKSSATSSITHSKLKTTYSVYITTEQPAGTYSGQVKYVMLHPSTTTVVPTNTLEQAFASAGKSKKTDVADPVTGQTGSFYRMQDMNSSICDAVTPNDNPGYDEIQLVDDRDDKIYWVAKLKDGNCWMTQNLDLDIGSANTATLTSENTDISTTASGSGIYNAAGGYTQNNGIWTWAPSNSAVTSNHIVNDTIVPGWSNQNALPYSAEGGDVYYYTSGTEEDDIKYNFAECIAAGHTISSCQHYHVGNYYNWPAAIASNNSSALTAQYANADNSICPKNWQLPIGNDSANTNRDFGILLASQDVTNGIMNNSYITNGFNNIRTTPLYFVRSGYIDISLKQQSSTGSYWSSTVNISKYNYAFNLYFNKNAANPVYGYDGSGYRMGFGGSVRCVAR